MSTKKNYVLLLGMIFFLYSQIISAQCLTAPPASPCTGTEPPVTNNETINVAVSKWFYGPDATFANLTLRGGTLTVCGNLTLQNFTIDSGTIYVVNGGKLRIEGGNGLQLFGNCRIYNYGTLQVTRNMSMENHYASALKPNVVINAAGARLDMLNQYFVINNPFSFFVNRGVADFHGIITDPGCAAGCVCLGHQSQTSMTVFHNKTKFSYTSPEGIACLSVSEFSQIWDTVTSSSTIALCLGTKHKADSSCIPFGCKPNAWGPVQIFTKCNSCVALMVLPVKIYDLNVRVDGNANRLNWKTDMPDAGFIFLIDRSPDGKTFFTIDTLKNGSVYYDNHPLQKSYYRIVCIDMQSGAKKQSNIAFMNRNKDVEVNVYPNPFKNAVTISMPAKTVIMRLQVIDMNGKIMHDNKNVNEIPANGVFTFKPILPGGIYYLKIVSDMGTTIRRLIKVE